MGVPRLACLRPAAWLKQRPGMARLHQPKLKTLAKGEASRDGRRKASSGTASPGRLARRRRDQGRSTSQGAHDANHDDQDQVGARRAPGGRQPAQCPRFLFGAKGESTGAEYRGIRQRFPYRCNKTKTSRTVGRRSPCSPRRCHHQCLWQSKTTFSQYSLY